MDDTYRLGNGELQWPDKGQLLKQLDEDFPHTMYWRCADRLLDSVPFIGADIITLHPMLCCCRSGPMGCRCKLDLGVGTYSNGVYNLGSGNVKIIEDDAVRAKLECDHAMNSLVFGLELPYYNLRTDLILDSNFASLGLQIQCRR